MDAIRRRSYLLQDPYDTDAIIYMRAMFVAFGLRPVCFYTDPRGRHYGERLHPVLTTSAVEASFDADLDDLADLADRVSERYDIVTVVPYREDTIEVAAVLIDLLGLTSHPHEVLARCRDKHRMKTALDAAVPPVRVPASRVAHSIDDVVGEPLPARWVIKPNNGMGSRGLAFFSANDSRAAIAAHLDRHPGETWTIEEFIDGVEFRINGLVRHDGTVQTLAIFEYLPEHIDDHFSLAYATESQVASTDPRFATLHKYATSVIDALEVRGVPFHMEAKIDDVGPALIDFGARVGSDGTGDVLSWLHPDRPDMYAVAARDYVGPNDFAMEPVDYSFYDSGITMAVYGISETAGTITSLDGLAEVEALPEFVSWIVKPTIGDALRRMSELRDSPYIAIFRHDQDRQFTADFAHRVRDMVRWNTTATMGDRFIGTASNIVSRALAKARWLLHDSRSR